MTASHLRSWEYSSRSQFRPAGIPIEEKRLVAFLLETLSQTGSLPVIPAAVAYEDGRHDVLGFPLKTVLSVNSRPSSLDHPPFSAKPE